MIPPPASTAALPERVLALRFNVLKEDAIPAPYVAAFPVTTLPVILSVPTLMIPPPSVAELLAMRLSTIANYDAVVERAAALGIPLDS